MLVVAYLHLGHKPHIRTTALTASASANAVGVGNRKSGRVIPTTAITTSETAKHVHLYIEQRIFSLPVAVVAPRLLPTLARCAR